MARKVRGDLTADLGTKEVATGVPIDSEILIPAEGNHGAVYITRSDVGGTVQIFGYDPESEEEWSEAAATTLDPADPDVPSDIQVFTYSMGPSFIRFTPDADGEVTFSARVME